MKMKPFTIVAIVLLFSALIYAGATFPTSPTGISSNGNILITFQTADEINVDHFAIERKTATGSEFVEVGRLNPEEDHYYEFVDENVFKTDDAVYIYRIKIVDKFGEPTYSNDFAVSHNTATTVKRTWGSIKALFR